MRILVVEDEAKLADNVAQVLRQILGAAVDVSNDGLDGLHMARSESYDTVILDLMLPEMDGMTVLRSLREGGHATPVLILTARDETEDVIAGLDAGSDDYLTKPFDMAELVARVRALVRRSYGQANPTLSLGGLIIDLGARQATVDGRKLHLRPLEFSLLEYLALRSEAIVSKSDILEHLYGHDAESFSNVIEVHVSRLRKELHRLGNPVQICTFRNAGYQIEAAQ